ncbi:uncharacterized protein LOC131018080 isoform X2 [Salvia miltiorrhiza]|uniref:uncharacterized protein LOC131018080 isoform X2 n=1 Tax=Salvia miltiorrhiza TaxID=226208 RepID=UPI0025AC21EA|nr:uncharacterized protein LOC131018080 isoform X2 [Salvia miltiorrhiza]
MLYVLFPQSLCQIRVVVHLPESPHSDSPLLSCFSFPSTEIFNKEELNSLKVFREIHKFVEATLLKNVLDQILQALLHSQGINLQAEPIRGKLGDGVVGQ